MLLGLAATRHTRSIIFRRESVSLRGMIDEARKLFGGAGQFNENTGVWKGLPDGRQIEFAGVKDAGDENKYRGRPHDLLCVARGTPILLADGSYRPVESVAIGDYVATLQGPRRVTRHLPRGWKACCVISDGITNTVVAADHKILTAYGWVSPLELRSIGCREVCTRQTGYREIFQESALPSWCSFQDRQQDVATVQRSRPGTAHRGSGVWSASVQTDSAESYGGRQEYSLPGRWYAPVALLARSADQAGQGLLLPIPHGVLSDALPCSSVQDCRLGYRALPDSCGGLALQRSATGQGRIPSQAGVAKLSWPDCSLDDREHTLLCTPLESFEYFHPYTMAEQVACEPVHVRVVEMALAGEAEVFDLTVEESRHYISFGGVVHKNCIDEADQFLESQVRFLMGWVRTTTPGQRCRVVMTFNPPSTAEGRWLLDYFGPWLDVRHPRPAKPGELRWYATLPSGKEVERPDGSAFPWEGETITPKSRSFIPARVQDNPYLMNTGYLAQLQALPEPLRSQVLYGDFQAGISDDASQCIPTEWVRAAMDRWQDGPPEGFELTAIGVDVARGGKDSTIISKRYANWFARLIRFPGEQTPDGPSAAARVIAVHADNAEVNVDVIGIGASCYDCLAGTLGGLVHGVNNAESAGELTEKSGKLKFVNVRAASYWRLREALDPASGSKLAIPPDPELLADLCAPKYTVLARGIKLESKDDIIKRIGRSPDRGDSVVLAYWTGTRGIDPFAFLKIVREVKEESRKGNTGADRHAAGTGLPNTQLIRTLHEIDETHPLDHPQGDIFWCNPHEVYYVYSGKENAKKVEFESADLVECLYKAFLLGMYADDERFQEIPAGRRDAIASGAKR